jgi:hypothetical protein
MGLYDIDWTSTEKGLSPQVRRFPRFLAWIGAIVSPTAWRQLLFFNEYANGSTAPNWSGYPNEYNQGDRVRRGWSIYEAQQNELVDVDPLLNSNAWLKVCDDFRGVNERVRYTGQKLILEYVLNHYFSTTWLQPNSPTSPTRPAIYINNNSVQNAVFTVFDDSQQSSKVFASDMYTESYVMNSYSFTSNCFTIYVPSTKFTALGLQAEQLIRSVADRYVIAGIQYNVTTY